MTTRRMTRFPGSVRSIVALCTLTGLLACAGLAQTEPPHKMSDGPDMSENPFRHQTGDAASGREVFRFETFGNEGFWTDAMRLPKGMMDAKFTPMDALKAGLHVDAEALSGDMRKALAKELKTDMSPRNAPMLHDPNTTVMLVNANAVIGVVPKDSNGDGRIDIRGGDKVGIACAICHTVTDGSIHGNLAMPLMGSIGKRLDGRATHSINMGALLAMAANSRAYYPNLQAELGGKTIGRAPKGLTENSTEAEVDAYLKNPRFYPVGTFDDTSDGNGNPVQNTPLFRTDLAAPWGSAGEHSLLDDISNGSYTVNLDLTSLATPEGLQFLKIKGGMAGEELHMDYVKILRDTGVTGYPFVRATTGHKVGDPATPVGRRVDNSKLLDMNAYLNRLPAPRGMKVERAVARRGRDLFRANCTSCHNVDQGKSVPPMLVEMKRIFPGYAPTVLALRKAPLTPIQNSPGIFDDKMIVEDASGRGDRRGNALPLLLDLARKPQFLHDASVPTLDALLDPARGPMAPHPFYIQDSGGRRDVVEFLRGLDTDD